MKASKWESVGNKFCRKIGIYYLWICRKEEGWELEIYYSGDPVYSRRIVNGGREMAQSKAEEYFARFLDSAKLDKYLLA